MIKYITTENITMIITMLILTISQVIMIITGKYKSADKIEEAKQKAINKLINKNNKTKNKFIKEQEKIEKLSKEIQNNGK